MFDWKKKGLIFEHQKFSSIHNSHVQTPVSYLNTDGSIQIFYASRCENQYSRIFRFVFRFEDNRVLRYEKEPLLDLGKPGTFDDSGVMPSSIIEHNNKIYLFYVGWNSRGGYKIPYQNSIGLAISNDGGVSFKRFSEGPLYGRSLYEPFFCGTSTVLYEDKTWKFWIMSCDGWLKDEKYEPTYNIKFLESKKITDLMIKKPKIAIDYKSKNEGGISKTSIVKIKDKYFMWFSYRSKFDYRNNKKNTYKIGFAYSNDGIGWERNDNLININLSSKGWDSQCMAYPEVLKYKNKLLMFYNGNDFGKYGIGLAIANI